MTDPIQRPNSTSLEKVFAQTHIPLSERTASSPGLTALATETFSENCPYSNHHDSSTHAHAHDEHAHTHGAIDPEIASSERGLWAVKWSFVGLFLTAIVQAIVVWLSDSVALLADLIHNVADASTAIPLGLAFLIGRWQPTRQFSYGYGRAEDLAGVAVVAIIAFSAVVAGYESVNRFFHPEPIEHLGALAAAGVIGFIGNTLVSLFRIRVGKAIRSAALIADGHHARADSLVSLAVVFGAIALWLGYPIADPLIGLLISAVLFRIVWDAGKTMLVRILDGVEPEIIDAIQHLVEPIADVTAASDIRARWLGHRLYAEVAIQLPSELSIQKGHAIAQHVQSRLQEHLPYLGRVAVQIGAEEQRERVKDTR